MCFLCEKLKDYQLFLFAIVLGIAIVLAAMITTGNIRQEGIFHCDDYIEPHDYFYVAYFGVIDFPMLGRQPAMMIAFTNNIDEESVKAEVVHDIDTAAQNCEPISE